MISRERKEGEEIEIKIDSFLCILDPHTQLIMVWLVTLIIYPFL